jgi:hypothetical protein
VKPESISDKDSVARLFYHEAQRVFHDRLINQEDKQYFYNILAEMAGKYFSQQIEPKSFYEKPIIFGDFMKMGADKADRLYEEITEHLSRLPRRLQLAIQQRCKDGILYGRNATYIKNCSDDPTR